MAKFDGAHAKTLSPLATARENRSGYVVIENTALEDQLYECGRFSSPRWTMDKCYAWYREWVCCPRMAHNVHGERSDATTAFCCHSLRRMSSGSVTSVPMGRLGSGWSKNNEFASAEQVYDGIRVEIVPRAWYSPRSLKRRIAWSIRLYVISFVTRKIV